MDSAQREQIRQHIQSEIGRLNLEIERHSEHLQPVAPDNAIGRLTRMEALNSQGIHQAQLGRAKTRLRRLTDTLDRIDHEDYGICRRCEDDIPFKRLLLIPEGPFCVECMG